MSHPAINNAAADIADAAVESLAAIHAAVEEYNTLVRALTILDPDHDFDYLEVPDDA